MGSGGDSGAVGNTAIRRTAPLTAMQRMAAARLTRSHHETAPVTLFGTADADALLILQGRLNESGAGRPDYTITHLMLKIVAECLGRHPSINAGLIDGQRHEWSDINISVAMALPDGNLIVPVIRKVDRKSLAEIAAELDELKAKGRAGKLALADVRTGTFTLSNAGAIKSARWATPIINLPQCAILGLGAVHEAPVVRNGELAVGRLLPMSLTFDHRLVNGYAALAFVDTLNGLIATPEPVGF
jgi:pyruvate/2-oxoglutarate dehydrogenase complex dihydrolipoamide acyltransferase (E2) component